MVNKGLAHHCWINSSGGVKIERLVHRLLASIVWMPESIGGEWEDFLYIRSPGWTRSPRPNRSFRKKRLYWRNGDAGKTRRPWTERTASKHQSTAKQLKIFVAWFTEVVITSVFSLGGSRWTGLPGVVGSVWTKGTLSIHASFNGNKMLPRLFFMLPGLNSTTVKLSFCL